MKTKNGFTLIELLAVIVILAIIALIATPIVLNIINDAKQESGLRSANFYLDALELSIAQATLDGQNITDNTYNILENGNICLKYDASEKCIEELKVEVKGETPKEGTITILNGEIEGALFTLDNKEITKNSKGEIVYIKTLDEVCELKEGTAKTVGAKYECKVDPNKAPYTFYVLSYNKSDGSITTTLSEAKSVNLIMDSNIRTGGEPVKEATPTPEQKGLIEWVNRNDYESVGGTLEDWEKICADCGNWNKGPITAMNYLKEVTKTWTNTNELKISTFNQCGWGNNNCTTHTMAKTYNTYVRMPYKSEVESHVNNLEVWILDYLSGEDDENIGITGKNSVNGLDGYWLLTAESNDCNVWGVYFTLPMDYNDVNNTAYKFGVRPVINLKI